MTNFFGVNQFSLTAGIGSSTNLLPSAGNAALWDGVILSIAETSGQITTKTYMFNTTTGYVAVGAYYAVSITGPITISVPYFIPNADFTDYSGFITVTNYDKANQIIEGTFGMQCTGVSKAKANNKSLTNINGLEDVSFTEGKFRCKYVLR